MAFIDETNIVNCAISEVLGTGYEGCNFDFSNLKDIRFYKRGTVVPSSTTYNKSYLRGLQQAGKMIPLNDLYDFTWTEPTDEVETADSTGNESVSRKGLYGLSAMWRKGLHQQKVLESLEGDGIWDLWLVDDKGNELFTETSTGGGKGFTTGRVSVNGINFNKGTTTQKTSIVVQFTNSTQFNRNIAWRESDTNDFLREELTGANEIKLSIPTAPSDGDTTIVVPTKLARGGDFVSGLGLANFLVKVNGSTVTPSAIAADADAKTYTFTVATLNSADTVEVSIYDSVASSGVAILNPGDDDVLYKSNSATSVVVA